MCEKQIDLYITKELETEGMLSEIFFIETLGCDCCLRSELSLFI